MATIVRLSNPRNINGTYTTPVVQLPANLGGKVYFYTELTDAQFANTAKTMKFSLEVSDNSVDWRLVCGFTWIGGPKYFNDGTPDYNRPGVGLNSVFRVAGKYVRIVIVTGAILNVGLRIEYTPN